MTSRPKLWTLEDVLAYLQLSRPTIYRMLNEGTFKGYNVGGGWRFDPEEVQAWVKAQANVGSHVGTLPNGSQRKASTLSDDETDAALDAIVKRAKARAR